MDTNGNIRYIYNFTDNETNLNKEFNYFGRVIKQGITNQYSPKEMQEWLDQFGIWLKITVGIELGKAQKDIDRCNEKSGCNKICSVNSQSICNKLQYHTKLMEKLSYLRDFLKLEIEEQ